MPLLLVWITLAAGLAATVAGIAFAVARGLALYRGAKKAASRLGGEAEAIAQRAGRAEEHLRRASESQDRLRSATGRLAESRARLDVQLAALREAKAALGLVAPFLARK